MMTIPFLNGPLSDAPALNDDAGNHVTYSQLDALVRSYAAQLEQEKSLVFLYTQNTTTTVVLLLGAMAAGHAVALLDGNLPEASRALLAEQYSPDIVIAEDRIIRVSAPTHPIHSDLALLLSTSGSTGGAKFVRLRLDSLLCNAQDIAQALDIRQDDTAAGHLPLHYSYGFSVLSSHLVTGARVVLTERGFMDREFWPLMKTEKVTHFPGVPFHYNMMLRLGLKRLGLDHLRTLTQAGGHLPLEIRQAVFDYMQSEGGKFYVMYGQTEAAPRITTLDHNDFAKHSGTVGRVLAHGRLSVRDEDGQELAQGQEGIIWYEGPNVMMGYAETREDLLLADTQQGQLATGDIGHLDTAGRLTITGRVKRFGKIYGLRVNLDEIERLAKSVWSDVAVTQRGEKLRVFLAGNADTETSAQLRDIFAEHYTLPMTAYEFQDIEALPFTERGKLNYRQLEALE